MLTAGAIVLSEAADVNATSLSVTWAGPAPSAEQHFSIGSALHRVRTFVASGAGAGTLTMRPWLRATAASGAPLNFDDPAFLVRFAKDDAMAVDLNL